VDAQGAGTWMTTEEDLNTMQNAKDRILSGLSSATWTLGTPVDQWDLMRKRFMRQTKLTTATPTPAVDRLMINATLTADPMTGQPRIRGRVMHELSEYGEMLMRELPPDQIGHRSRPATLASGRLQLNELSKRVTGIKANYQNLLQYSVPTNTSQELLTIKRNAALPRLKIDHEWIRHYINEHKDSSIVPGIKWGGLPDPDNDPGFYREWFEIVKAGLELALDGEHRFDTTFNFGMRARADQAVTTSVIDYDLEITRTRIVTFHPSLSTVFLFMPDKKGMYKDVFERTLDLFDYNRNVLFPPVHGGEVYLAAASGLHDGEDCDIILGDDCNRYIRGKQYGYDGANWETQVGTLLGEPFYGTKTYFAGHYHVPSGVWDTTLDDTLATMWVASQFLDDKGQVEIANVMERETADEDVNFMLGLRYVDDPLEPRLQGLKLSTDKATSSVTLPRGRMLELTNSYSEDQSLRWYLGYLGQTIDGESILTTLESIDGNDWKSGVVDQVISGEL